MAVVPLIVMAVGAAVSAVGSIQQGDATAAADKYNAQIDLQEGQEAQTQANAQERTFNIQTRQGLGTERSEYGAAGVDAGGSTGSVIQSNAAQSELSALNIQYGSKLQQLSYQEAANLGEAAGSNAQTAGYLSAAGTLLKSSGSIAYGVSGGSGSTSNPNSGSYGAYNLLQVQN